MKKGNVGAAKASLAKAERSAGRHMKNNQYLIERLAVVLEHYKQKERDHTACMNNVLAQEQSVVSQKSAAEVQLSYKEQELSCYRLRSDLSSAESRLSEARRKAEEANTGKVITGVAVGLLTIAIFTLSAAAPALGSVAMGTGMGALAFSQTEEDAEEDIRRCHARIYGIEEKKSQIKHSISSLSEYISQLSIQKSSYIAQCSHLQEEKGKIKEDIAFVLDAQQYWSQFSATTNNCINSTAYTGELVVKAEAQAYNLFDSRGTKRVLATLKEAWDALEEMNESGSNYNFEIDFKCTRCSNSYQQFPHVNSGQLICSSCHRNFN